MSRKQRPASRLDGLGSHLRTLQCAGAVHVIAGLKRTRFRLAPGEKVRLPSILAMNYVGDWIDGQNQFRRFMLAHCTPTRPRAVPGRLTGRRTQGEIESAAAAGTAPCPGVNVRVCAQMPAFFFF